MGGKGVQGEASREGGTRRADQGVDELETVIGGCG